MTSEFGTEDAQRNFRVSAGEKDNPPIAFGLPAEFLGPSQHRDHDFFKFGNLSACGALKNHHYHLLIPGNKGLL
jgi:hypothetical protein